MSPGSCPLVKVSGEMFTSLDDQGEQAVQGFSAHAELTHKLHTTSHVRLTLC